MGVLDDVTAVELSIAIAAPSCGRALAFHGAEMIKLESRTNPDVSRLFGSAWATGVDPAVYMDTSPYLGEMSASKRSVGLELKHPDGLRAALSLLAHSDVFVTNYSTPAVRALGLGYEAVRAVNPSIVYVAMPAFGSDDTQPYYEFLAWGPNQAPLVGLDALTGYPDQDPAGIATIAPPDYFAGLHALAAVLTGLEHRDRTGEGTFVDIAQFETTVSSLGPWLFDYALTNRLPERAGSRVPWLAPQGCYGCIGDDAWVAISVGNDDEWAALAGLLGLTDDSRFATLEGRQTNHDDIDALIHAWTATHTPREAATTLQAAGVPAYEVLDNIGVLHDPQVLDRGWFQCAPCLRFPEGDVFGGHPIRFSDTPGRWWRAGPAMGQDTIEMLTKRAGFTMAEIDALMASGAAFVEAEPDQTVRRPYTDYIDVLGIHRTVP